MENTSLGQQVKEARLRKGLTQTELADSSRLDIRTIQRIESGKVKPRLYTMRLLSEVLGSKFSQAENDALWRETSALRKVFQRRRQYRIATAGLAILLMVAIVILTDSNWNLFGLPKRTWAPAFYLVMFTHLIGIVVMWRCPGCKGMLGDVFNTRFCPKCGLKFYKEL